MRGERQLAKPDVGRPLMGGVGRIAAQAHENFLHEYLETCLGRLKLVLRWQMLCTAHKKVRMKISDWPGFFVQPSQDGFDAAPCMSHHLREGRGSKHGRNVIHDRSKEQSR